MNSITTEEKNQENWISINFIAIAIYAWYDLSGIALEIQNKSTTITSTTKIINTFLIIIWMCVGARDAT